MFNRIWKHRQEKQDNGNKNALTFEFITNLTKLASKMAKADKIIHIRNQYGNNFNNFTS